MLQALQDLCTPTECKKFIPFQSSTIIHQLLFQFLYGCLHQSKYDSYLYQNTVQRSKLNLSAKCRWAEYKFFTVSTRTGDIALLIDEADELLFGQINGHFVALTILENYSRRNKKLNSVLKI